MLLAPHSHHLFRMAAGASQAFAPATSALDPTTDEAIEEHRRAKSYRDSAPLIGVVVGGAVGLSLLALRAR